MTVQPIPKGYHNAVPCLNIRGAAHALDFCKQTFGATELVHMDGPDGTIAHTEIRIGNSPTTMSDEVPDMVCASPDTLQSTSAGLVIYMSNVDAAFANALKAGSTGARPVVDQSYSDRSGTLKDPFGHVWTVPTHVEDVAPDEMARRMEKWTEEQAATSA